MFISHFFPSVFGFFWNRSETTMLLQGVFNNIGYIDSPVEKRNPARRYVT